MFTRLVSVAALALVAFSVNAATSYEISDAISDPVYHSGNGDHSLWLKDYPGGNSFNLDAGFVSSFVENDDGTANLMGTASNGTSTFTFDFTYSAYVAADEAAPSGSPKRELKDSAYIEDGGPVDTADWSYYSDLSGTLTELVGGVETTYVLSVSDVGPAFQIGEGANGKNINLGASGWFNAVNIDDSTETFKGDINIDIEVVPVPAAVWLFASGLGLLGFSRRKA